MSMRMIGIKFFRWLNVERFFLGGVEVTATAAQINAGAGVTTAAGIGIADAGNRITGTNVETALQEIVGSGRTNETIKGVSDAAGAKYTKPGTGIPGTDLAAAVQTSLGKADTALQPASSIIIPTGTPVNAVAASKVMTVDGVAIHGELVTIENDIYEFRADVAQAVTGGKLPIDISTYATKSQGILTVDTQPTSGDTMTIGTKIYTFVPPASANGDGDISRGTDLPSAKLAIVAAINGSDGHNTAHPLVSASAFNVNVCTLTALAGGVAGDLIASTSNFTAGSNQFNGATLGTTTPGADCSKANAKAALIAAVTAHDTQGVGATAAGGDTLTLAADIKGIAGNDIDISTTMAHGSFAGGATALSAGVNGTLGTQWQEMVDASYLYICIAANTIADANWRKISLGSAY